MSERMSVPELTRWLAARDIRVLPSAEDGFDLDVPEDLQDADFTVVLRHAGLLEVLLTRPYACGCPGCPCRVNAWRARMERVLGGGRQKAQGT